jgi:hypothetical protein
MGDVGREAIADIEASRGKAASQQGVPHIEARLWK